MDAFAIRKLMTVRVGLGHYDPSTDLTLDHIIYSYFRNTEKMDVEPASQATDKFIAALKQRVMNGALEEIDA